MHKNWLVIVLFYFLIFAVGTAVFMLKDKEPGEPLDDEYGVNTDWKPNLRRGNEIVIITLDDSSRELAKHIERGHRVRLCVRAEEKRTRPPGGWCGPILTVAGVSDDLDDSPWLALYVPTTDGLGDSASYIVADQQVLLYVDAGGEDTTRRDEERDNDHQSVGYGKDGGAAENGAQPDGQKDIGVSYRGKDPVGAVVVQRIDGRIDIVGIFLQVLKYASESGIDLAKGTTKSLRDLAVEAAGEFIKAFAKTAGDEAAKELFGRVSWDGGPGEGPSESDEPPDRSRGPAIVVANVYFHVNEPSVPNIQNAVALVADITRLAREQPGCTVTVFGHADTSGSSRYNRRLSESRAKSVAALLNAFSPDSLQVRACGEARPQQATGDGVLEGKNRRVEVIASCTSGSHTTPPTSSGFGQPKESLCEKIEG